MKKLLALIITFAAIGLASCEKTDTPVGPGGSSNVTSRALFVVNEGAFNKSNSSLDVILFHKDSVKKIDTVIHNVISGLGSGNDIIIHNNRAYVLDNTSNAITVVDADTLRKVSLISIGVDQPNKMAIWGNKMIVTRRSSSIASAAVIDLTTNTIVDSIVIGEPSVAVGVLGNTAYITSGGYTGPGHVSIVDLNTLKVTKKIEVISGPEKLAIDTANAQALILSFGEYGVTGPRLYFLPAATGAITDSVNVGAVKSSATLIYGVKTYVLQSAANSTKVTAIDGAARKLGSLVLDLATQYYEGYFDTKSDAFYLGSYDFSNQGNVAVYDATTGALRTTVPAGIAPAHFAFYH